MGRDAVIVLDTHAWVWWAGESKKLSRRARAAIGSADRVGVPAICCWEVAMLVARKRLAFDRPVLTWIREALELPSTELIPLSPDIAVTSASLEGKLQGDSADRHIVATALRHSARLVTKDERITAAKIVATVW